MATEVYMPALGIAQDSGKLIEWLKSEGQWVEKGEPIMVIETDKTTVEYEAPASGYLANLSAKAGDDVPVGQVIALILSEGEQTSASPIASSPQSIPPAPQPASTHSVSATPLAARLAEEHGISLEKIPAQGRRIQKEDVLAYLESQSKPSQRNEAGILLASPKARRLAQENKLDLRAIRGSGPQGAVLAQDVLNTLSAQPAAAPTPVPSTPAAQTAELSRMWKTMAQRMTESWQNVPHFYLETEVNASQLVAWRQSLQQRTSQKITFTDLLIKLTAIALRRHPRLNASWREGNLVQNQDINIGLAVAVEEGLLVPVIHRADILGVVEIARRREKLVTSAQANRLSLTDLTGGTFTLSNLGMYGIENFNAIINPPEAGILAVGKITEKFVPLNGQAALQARLRLTLSVDHRVVDGARGAMFLQTLTTLIEEPLSVLDE
ncbi:MAG: dihydrolipoamide acetyltransferase family protein [Chloroflexota bacterium]